MMKILQTIGSMAPNSGGTSSCTYQLMGALHMLEKDAHLLTIQTKDNSTLNLGNGCEWLIDLPNDYFTPYSYSQNIKKFLGNTSYDLYHTNGLWMYINHITCTTARNNNRPYVITPHGMLYANALKRSRYKKLPLEWLFFKNDIMKSSCIHVTCGEEMRQVRRYGYTGPIAIIGNPIKIPEYVDDVKNECYSINNNVRVLGFLGRLHPIKQIEKVIQGLGLLSCKKQKQVKLVIMGEGDESYIKFLHQEIIRLHLQDVVEFKGFVTGRRKFEELSKLSALFVPSEMENFGMIVPEALLVHTPVMASFGTPWQQLNENRCGWWVDASPDSIAEVIEDILAKSFPELKKMGARGNAYVRKHYAADVVASKMLQLYQWILNPNDVQRPAFVYL